MSEEQHKKNRVKITTSAPLTKAQQEQVVKELEMMEEKDREELLKVEQSQRLMPPKVAPWSKSEPLSKIHSILGHVAQGDAYRNGLDLIYDRLQGEAEAPEYISADNEDPPEAMEPIIARRTEKWSMEPESITGGATEAWSFDTDSFGESAGDIVSDIASDRVSTDPFAMTSREKVYKSTVDNSEDEKENRDKDVSSSEILDGVGIEEFEKLQQTAKSSGTLTRADVNEFLSKQAIESVSDESIAALSGDSEVNWQSLEDSKSTVKSSSPPQRQRRPGQAPTPFFKSQNTAVNTELSSGKADSPSSNASSEALGLGDQEDTIID